MSHRTFIYMYDGYDDLHVLSLMARRLESLTICSCQKKKVALSSQLHLFKDPDLTAVQALARQTNFQLSYRVTGEWISFPKGKETPVLHLRIPKTLQKTFVGMNYLELFLISKNMSLDRVRA